MPVWMKPRDPHGSTRQKRLRVEAAAALLCLRLLSMADDAAQPCWWLDDEG